MTSILEPNRAYTFSDYFGLPFSTAEIVAEFGYQYEFKRLDLPRASLENVRLDDLRKHYYENARFYSLSTETARREFYVAPLFFKLLEYVQPQIEVEYALNINDKLKGNIDYLLRGDANFIVVEAKFADLEHGFTQLAVEMIAVEKLLESREQSQELIFGAVTVGDYWRFGILDRTRKIVFKDIESIALPTGLSDLFAVLLGILQS